MRVGYLLFCTRVANSRKLPQGARKSGAKTALLRALLALTVSIDLSALDGERDEMRVGEGGEGQQGEIRVGPEAVPRGGSVQNPMQKATTSARSGRRSGGCYAFDNRAKPDAKSDDFGAVWTQVRRLLRFLEACKTRCKKRPFWRGLDAGPEAVALP